MIGCRLKECSALSCLVNTHPYHVVLAKAGMHAQHGTNTISGMDPHLRGDDNNGQKLEDAAVVSY